MVLLIQVVIHYQLFHFVFHCLMFHFVTSVSLFNVRVDHVLISPCSHDITSLTLVDTLNANNTVRVCVNTLILVLYVTGVWHDITLICG